MKRKFFTKPCLLFSLTVLTACGGGSPDPTTNTSINDQQVTGTGTGTGTGLVSATNVTETSFAKACGSVTEVLFARSELASANSNVEVMALACGAPITSPKWTQTSGDTVSFLSGRSQAITFLPTSSGMQGFAFTYKDSSGMSQKRDVRINVAAASSDQNIAVIRGEPSVWPASATSLRVWLPSSVNSTDLSTATYKWKLPEVANIKLDNDTRPNVILTPATVANDTVVPVAVDVQLTDGRKWTQQFTLLVQKPDPTPSRPLTQTASTSPYALFEDAAQVYPYVATNNPYASLLKKCVYARSIAADYNTICKMSILPLLGQTAKDAIPTVEEVMQRVLVSND